MLLPLLRRVQGAALPSNTPRAQWGRPRTDTVLMSSKPYSEACERNREPIAAALDPWMGDRHRVLEIGSGTGQHAAFFAERWPRLRWQPSDHPYHLPGIEAWRAETALLNLLPPVALQVELPPAPGLNLAPGSTFDAAFSANTLHIMSWAHVQSLFAALPPCCATVRCWRCMARSTTAAATPATAMRSSMPG